MRDFEWDSLFILLGVVGGIAVLGTIGLKGCVVVNDGEKARAAAITECVKAGRDPLACRSAHSREVP